MITRPSNKIIGLIVVVILIVGTVAYTKFSSQQATQKETDNNGILSYSSPTDSDTTDTDPNAGTISPDTAFANSDYLSPSDNLTDRFAQTAFATYVNLENNGNSDDDSQTETVNLLAPEAATVANPDAYSLSDIKTFSGTDPVALRNYGNSFVSIQQNNLNIIAQDPDKYNSDLPAIADIYDTISKDLLALPVPEALAQLHLQAVNDYHNIAIDFGDLDDYSDDPLKGMAALQQISDMQADEASSSEEMSAYFQANGIIFSNTEAGSAFNSQ